MKAESGSAEVPRFYPTERFEPICEAPGERTTARDRGEEGKAPGRRRFEHGPVVRVENNPHRRVPYVQVACTQKRSESQTGQSPGCREQRDLEACVPEAQQRGGAWPCGRRVREIDSPSPPQLDEAGYAEGQGAARLRHPLSGHTTDPAVHGGGGTIGRIGLIGRRGLRTHRARGHQQGYQSGPEGRSQRTKLRSGFVHSGQTAGSPVAVSIGSSRLVRGIRSGSSDAR